MNVCHLSVEYNTQAASQNMARSLFRQRGAFWNVRAHLERSKESDAV